MKKEILRRNTRQRRIILEELKKVKIHPTADRVFSMARRRLPDISFGTVYRNLNMLRDEGEVLELTCGKYKCRYDGDTKAHYHFFCINCKNVFDVNIPVLRGLDKKVSEALKFQINYHRVEFYGYCRDCK